jgi:hypothetical protein
MSDNVLLVINCQEDTLYSHRHLIRNLYQSRFPRISFLVNPTCPLDHEYSNIVVRWTPPPFSPARECSCRHRCPEPHTQDLHVRHPRLIDVADAATEAGVEAVLYSDTDCVFSPTLDATAIARRCRRFDAITPPIAHHPRGDRSWIWAHNDVGFPALDRMSRALDRQRLLDHWKALGGRLAGDDPDPLVPMFMGFADWLAFPTEVLQRVARDCLVLQQVWHEAAIPTAIVHNTSRIQFARCRVLWGEDRNRPLAELMAMLPDNDFVHPIKFGEHRAAIVEQYRALEHALLSR